MRCTSTFVLAALAVGDAMAGPTHAHLHRKIHEKKAIDWSKLDWNAMGIDWASAYADGKASKNTAAASSAATAAPASAPAAKQAATANTAATDLTSALFAGVVGASNKLASFGQATAAGSAPQGDFYVGNVGSPYGSNVVKVSSTQGYQYTNTFVNTQSKAITVNIWNKIGSDGSPLSGSALAPKDTSLTFVLAPGASQIVAFQENSQVGWAEATSAISASGAFATTWGEANFKSSGSGYDMSAIMNAAGNTYNMAISSVEAPQCTSDMTQNFWLTDKQPIGDSNGSCFIMQSSATLTTKMGGTV